MLFSKGSQSQMFVANFSMGRLSQIFGKGSQSRMFIYCSWWQFYKFSKGSQSQMLSFSGDKYKYFQMC